MVHQAPVTGDHSKYGTYGVHKNPHIYLFLLATFGLCFLRLPVIAWPPYVPCTYMILLGGAHDSEEIDPSARECSVSTCNAYNTYNAHNTCNTLRFDSLKD